MNPAAIAVVELYACLARLRRARGVNVTDVPWLPNHCWACVSAPLPADLRAEAVLFGLEVIIVGLAQMLSEAPN